MHTPGYGVEESSSGATGAILEPNYVWFQNEIAIMYFIYVNLGV